ncbi:MAG: ATP-binding protein [Vibrio gallaecicus]|uniref:ATP-binding protein n=1 Tax=Vibrio sp. 99-70-13A1 TaxID=2607601 RepID=UPI001493AF4D|nr:ATP-binding protein [Vibrio sp. 99-70-13A1]NOH97828.1 two-component sensor histidine kinase [Vibrio sp. 99-70-13A1]
MIRAFSILWLAVFIPIALLLFPTAINPVQHVTEYFSEGFYKKVYTVNFEMLTEKLSNHPQEKWQPVIKKYETHFGYPLKLQPMSTYQSNRQSYDAIQGGEITFLFGDPMALVQRVGKSDQVIYFALNESTELAVLNQAKGTLFLAAEDLRNHPQSQWVQIIENTNTQIPFRISLKKDDKLPPEAKEALTNKPRKIISYTSTNGQIELLAPVIDNVWLHIEDDLSHLTQIKLIATVCAFFVFFISIAMVMWVYPLWRDLKRLVKTANDFGQGLLSKRASTTKMSVISQLSDSFNKMADNIERLIASQRELTNAVAHDLRTPLYRLRFALEMIEDDQIAEEQKEKYRKTVHSSIEDLDHLINQNLLLSRYTRVADISHFSECCFAEQLLDEIEQFKLEHPELETRFYCSPDLKERSLFIDNKGLMRAIKNLLTNASRFAQSEINVSFKIEDQQYKIIIEDDGCGVPVEQSKYIFEPFSQLDNQERGSDKGHGLGLAIVKQIMNWHNGSATVDTSASQGARFVLSWPTSLNRQPK